MSENDLEDNYQNNEVIYSNNISEIGKDSFSQNSINNYDINTTSNTKSELELSYITKDSLIEDEDNSDNKLIIQIIPNNISKEHDILLYGNDINNLYPKYLGKMLSFIYYKNNPLICIGPDCKFFLIY